MSPCACVAGCLQQAWQEARLITNYPATPLSPTPHTPATPGTHLQAWKYSPSASAYCVLSRWQCPTMSMSGSEAGCLVRSGWRCFTPCRMLPVSVR